ncbi:MAG TPA: cytochrome c3 family protein [Dissulfurispiraceae bacterium]|nr:cytochrome c3 family protein [Dissulfurispiraceae bacterium]
MGNHVFRPLFLVIGIIILTLLVRHFYVPRDFGIHQRGYMYGWYREGNIEDWKKVRVKYQGRDYCKDCHSDKFASIMESPHAIIQCENCHGPAMDHPADPPKLAIDRSRALCLRCHYPLPYPTSGRAKIKWIDPDKHNRDFQCSNCHNPHKPNLSIQ